jgi:hypothetical protein
MHVEDRASRRTARALHSSKVSRKETASAYQEMARIIVRFAKRDEEVPTTLGNLHFNRRSSPTQPVHTAQWPCFALVVQGAKSLTPASRATSARLCPAPRST